jgi:hypothetical protein
MSDIAALINQVKVLVDQLAQQVQPAVIDLHPQPQTAVDALEKAGAKPLSANPSVFEVPYTLLEAVANSNPFAFNGLNSVTVKVADPKIGAKQAITQVIGQFHPGQLIIVNDRYDQYGFGSALFL